MTDDEELTAARLVGSWSLESLEVSGADAVKRADFPDVSGLLTYTGSGHVCALVQAPEDLFGLPFVAYGGRFTVKDEKIVHDVTIGLRPTVPGVVLVREASITGSDGDAAALRISGRIGQAHTTLLWRRNGPR